MQKLRKLSIQSEAKGTPAVICDSYRQLSSGDGAVALRVAPPKFFLLW